MTSPTTAKITWFLSVLHTEECPYLDISFRPQVNALNCTSVGIPRHKLDSLCPTQEAFSYGLMHSSDVLDVHLIILSNNQDIRCF